MYAAMQVYHPTAQTVDQKGGYGTEKTRAREREKGSSWRVYM